MDGAESAFEEFVRARWTPLVRYGYVLTGSPHDAADLAQEALAPLGSAWPRLVRRNIQLLDFEPGVLSFRADEHDRFVLDLRGIR
ncbi:hypothetical protein GCM10023176_12450 [Micromonospora coerulea]|uniref:Uncharacterized protein n=1 Tax=Micromonospora coerulea TaxID=47856 RepID=A0ABP8SCE5_9ACTN